MTGASVESVDTSGKGCVVTVKTAKGEERSNVMSFFLLLVFKRTLKTSVWRNLGSLLTKDAFW